MPRLRFWSPVGECMGGDWCFSHTLIFLSPPPQSLPPPSVKISKVCPEVRTILEVRIYIKVYCSISKLVSGNTVQQATREWYWNIGGFDFFRLACAGLLSIWVCNLPLIHCDSLLLFWVPASLLPSHETHFKCFSIGTFNTIYMPHLNFHLPETLKDTSLDYLCC